MKGQVVGCTVSYQKLGRGKTLTSTQHVVISPTKLEDQWTTQTNEGCCKELLNTGHELAKVFLNGSAAMMGALGHLS